MDAVEVSVAQLFSVCLEPQSFSHWFMFVCLAPQPVSYRLHCYCSPGGWSRNGSNALPPEWQFTLGCKNIKSGASAFSWAQKWFPAAWAGKDDTGNGLQGHGWTWVNCLRY